MPDDQEDNGIKDTLSNINPFSSSEEAEEREERSEIDPKPGLILDISRHQVKFPQNADEANFLDDKAGHLVTEDLLEQYRSGETTGIDRLIYDVENLMKSAPGTDMSIPEFMEMNRNELEEVLDRLETELRLKNEEQKLNDDWSYRLKRVLKLFESIAKNLPEDLSRVPTSDINRILIGDDPFGLSTRELERGNQGLEFDTQTKIGALVEVRDIKYDSTRFTRQNRYGMAHALQDLRKINSQVISPLLSETEKEVEGTRDSLDELAGIVERNEELFLQLMKIRLNLQQLEDREDIAEEIVEEIKSGDGKRRIEEQNMNALVQPLESEEEYTHNLKSRSDQLLRQEAWMAQGLQRAHEMMEESFNVSDHIVENEERYRAKVEGQGRSVNPQEFLKTLNNLAAGGSAEDLLSDTLEQYRNMRNSLREIQSMEFDDVENLAIMDKRLNNTANKIESATRLREKVEELEAKEYNDLEELEEKKDRIVEETLANIRQTIQDSFEESKLGNLEQEFENAIDELEEAGKELDKIEQAKEDDIKKDESVRDNLEFVGRALSKVNAQVEDDFTYGTPKVDISVQNEEGNEVSFEGSLDEVLTEILSHLEDIDEHVNREVETEENEEEDLFEAVERFRDAKQRVEAMSKGWERIHTSIEDMKSRAEDLPDDVSEAAMNQFRMEMEMLDEDKVVEYMKQSSDGRVMQMLEAAEDLLEKVGHEDQKEAAMLDEISNLSQKEDEKVVEHLIRTLENHKGEMPESTEAINSLQGIHSDLSDIDKKQNVIKTDISEEVDLIK